MVLLPEWLALMVMNAIYHDVFFAVLAVEDLGMPCWRGDKF
jgi:hypothetical protein